jgi:Domain of unknown function (DUF4189)
LKNVLNLRKIAPHAAVSEVLSTGAALKSTLRHLLLCLACAALPAHAQTFNFNYPQSWTLTSVPDARNKGGYPTAHFSSSADRVEADVSILENRDASRLSAADLRNVLAEVVSERLPESVEGRANPVANAVTFAGGAGSYVRLTYRKPGSAKYLTTAVFRSGRELVLGILASNDDNAAMLTPFLNILASVEAKAPAAGAAAPAAAAVRPAGAPVWAAIATEAHDANNEFADDPYYGVGEGPTQADAEKSALKFCREAGGKRCTAQVAYNQCGAYAASASSFGSGSGPSKKAAEQAALAACQRRSCALVVSDCN